MRITINGLADKRYSQTKSAVRVWRLATSALIALAILVAVVSFCRTPKQPKVTHDWTQGELDQFNCEINPASCPKASPKPRKTSFMKGYVSYYSNAGCLGCRADLKTASGEIFDENALTLAHQQLPLRSKVRITNLDNGKSVVARVNDRGGFNKYGRIADLSLATCKAIDCKTDKSLIVIEKL